MRATVAMLVAIQVLSSWRRGTAETVTLLSETFESCSVVAAPLPLPILNCEARTWTSFSPVSAGVPLKTFDVNLPSNATTSAFKLAGNYVSIAVPLSTIGYSNVTIAWEANTGGLGIGEHCNITVRKIPTGPTFGSFGFNPDTCETVDQEQCLDFSAYSKRFDGTSDATLLFVAFELSSSSPGAFCYIDNVVITGERTLQPSSSPTTTPTASPTLASRTPKPTVAPTSSPTTGPSVFDPPPKEQAIFVPILAGSAGAIGALLLLACAFHGLKDTNENKDTYDGALKAIVLSTSSKKLNESAIEEAQNPLRRTDSEGRTAIFIREHIPKKMRSESKASSPRSSAKPSTEYLQNIAGNTRSIFRPSHGYLDRFGGEDQEEEGDKQSLNNEKKEYDLEEKL